MTRCPQHTPPEDCPQHDDDDHTDAWSTGYTAGAKDRSAELARDLYGLADLIREQHLAWEATYDNIRRAADHYRDQPAMTANPYNNHAWRKLAAQRKAIGEANNEPCCRCGGERPRRVPATDAAMTEAACTVRCYGCDWTTTVIGMEAAHDAMIDHYKAKHWTPEKETPDAR